MGTVLRKKTLPAARARGSQAGVGVCEPWSQHNSQHPLSVTASCCPLSCQKAVWVSFMRKQRLHASFSEVRADLAQLPGLSISPCSHCHHHLQKLSSFHQPQNSQVPAWSSPQRPTPAQASTFQFPPSQLRDGQQDVVCLGGKTKDLAAQPPVPRLPWAVGTAAPQFLGVPWLKCTHALVAAHLQRQSRTSATGGETEARAGCGLAKQSCQEDRDVLVWSCLRSLGPFRNLEAPAALAVQMLQVLPFLPEPSLGRAEAQGGGRGSIQTIGACAEMKKGPSCRRVQLG